MDTTTESAEPTPKPPPQQWRDLTDEQRARLQPYFLEGWKIRSRRRQPVNTVLDDAQVAELGKLGNTINDDLRAAERARKDLNNALNDEKAHRKGAITSLSERLATGKDEMGRQLTVSELAWYTRRVAALREEYDAFLAESKARRAAASEEEQRLEEEQQAIARKIRSGRGAVHVDVVDLVDYAGGEILVIRLDNGDELHRRGLSDHERQLELFGRASGLPALSVTEYAYACAGRIGDAARSYSKRCSISESEARKAVRLLMPDEDLPPEPEEVDDDLDDDEGLDDDIDPATDDTSGGDLEGDGVTGSEDDLPPEAGEVDVDRDHQVDHTVTFDVVLVGVVEGTSRSPLADVIRKLTGSTVKNARELVAEVMDDGQPRAVLLNVAEGDAFTGADAIKRGGGIVETRRSQPAPVSGKDAAAGSDN
jgi:hypothetical protein